MQERSLRQIHLLTALLLFLLTTLLVTPTSLAEDDNTFVVGMEAGYPPFNWTQQDDSFETAKIQGGNEYAGGYDVEIAKKIADGLGKELVIFKTTWDGLAPAVTSGKVDAIIAGMSPTEERKKTIDFTDFYYTSNLVILVKKDGAFADAQNLEDFKGAKITAQLNTLHYDMIDQINGVNKQTAMDDFPAMRVALESGKIDGYVTEKPEGITAEQLNPNFKMIDFKDGQGFETTPEDTALAIGMKKGNPQIEQVNEILAGISEAERDNLMDIAISRQPDGDTNEVWVIKIVKENWQMFLRGAGVTLLISLVGTIVGTFIGLGIGLFRTIPKATKSINRILYNIVNALFSIYIEIFRGTPMIVQAMVIYYGSSQAFGVDLNPLGAALFIVSINTGAYMTEIVRGGIFSVDKGQFEAASAIGMTHWQTMTNVVIPQVFRNILPAMGNEFVINIKDTSVLNVIAVTELYFQAKTVAGSNFRFFDTFFVVCVIYFVMTFTVTRILRYLERKMDGTRHYAPYANQLQTPILEREGEEK
ncbi:ABC transporter permease subunit [Vagococcus jeotgali]|uniref:ABC transporter permease subunit n=1 Tax=Vagococcus jeotgali TaxID=3109030 RepID=UPI002DD7E5EC|nr:ABC transporter permease subunit [Vagococcus sp. B2T-5]